MSKWKSIQTAPKDGRPVWVRRCYEGKIVKEGWAVWSINSADAPMRHTQDAGTPWALDADIAYADTARWLTEDRRFSFPNPTEWRPDFKAFQICSHASIAMRITELPRWEKIDTAPRDGTRVWVKRYHRRSVVKEGWAVWDTYADDASLRQGQNGCAPSPSNIAFADTPQWLTEDRQQAFPPPTHWCSNRAAHADLPSE